MVADGLPKVFKDKRMIQKVLFLFRASPFAPVRGGGYPESELSDIRRHTTSRLPDGRLKRNKIKKPPLAVKKARLSAGTKTAMKHEIIDRFRGCIYGQAMAMP